DIAGSRGKTLCGCRCDQGGPVGAVCSNQDLQYPENGFVIFYCLPAQVDDRLYCVLIFFPDIVQHNLPSVLKSCNLAGDSLRELKHEISKSPALIGEILNGDP